MLGNVVLYFVIYIISTVISSFTYALVYSIKNAGKVDQSQVNAMVLKNQFLIAAIGGIIALGIFVLMFRKKEMNLFQRCKFTKINLKNSSIIILSSLGLALFSCSLVNLLMSKFPSYSETSKAISSNNTSVIGVISMILIIPIIEEILFRGLIFNELKKHLNIVVAIILQAVIFAASHGNMLQGIYTFIMAVVLAVVYSKTKSIVAPILFHMTYNLFGSIVIPVILNALGSFYIGFLILGAIILAVALILLFKSNVNVVTNDNLTAEI